MYEIVLYSPEEPWLCSAFPTSAFLQDLALCASWTSWSSPVSGMWHRTSPLLPRHLSEQTRHTKASDINTKTLKQPQHSNSLCTHNISTTISLIRGHYLLISEKWHTSRYSNCTKTIRTWKWNITMMKHLRCRIRKDIWTIKLNVYVTIQMKIIQRHIYEMPWTKHSSTHTTSSEDHHKVHKQI